MLNPNWVTSIFRGKTQDRPFSKRNSQKNTVWGLLRERASSLGETSSTQKLSRGNFLAISWHPELAVNWTLELVSCRDELQACAFNSLILARILLLLLRLWYIIVRGKKIWLELVSGRDELHWNGLVLAGTRLYQRRVPLKMIPHVI